MRDFSWKWNFFSQVYRVGPNGWKWINFSCPQPPLQCLSPSTCLYFLTARVEPISLLDGPLTPSIKSRPKRKAHDIDCDLFQCVETIRPGSIHNARQWPLVRHPSAPAVPLQPETHGGYIAGKDFAIYRREVHSNLHVYETDSKGFRSGYIHA